MMGAWAFRLARSASISRRGRARRPYALAGEARQLDVTGQEDGISPPYFDKRHEMLYEAQQR